MEHVRGSAFRACIICGCNCFALMVCFRDRYLARLARHCRREKSLSERQERRFLREEVMRLSSGCGQKPS